MTHIRSVKSWCSLISLRKNVQKLNMFFLANIKECRRFSNPSYKRCWARLPHPEALHVHSDVQIVSFFSFPSWRPLRGKQSSDYLKYISIFMIDSRFFFWEDLHTAAPWLPSMPGIPGNPDSPLVPLQPSAPGLPRGPPWPGWPFTENNNSSNSKYFPSSIQSVGTYRNPIVPSEPRYASHPL